MMKKRLLLVYWISLWAIALAGCTEAKNDGRDNLPTLVPALSTTEPDSTSSVSATAIVTAEPVVTPDIDPPAQTRAPIRLNLAPGAVSETVEGTIEPPNRDSYLFQALAGQEITVKLSSPEGLANFELSGLTEGQPYKRLVNEERQWTGLAPVSQDYRLDVATAQEVSPYLLTVTILTIEAPAGEEEPADLEAPLMFSPDGQWQVLATISNPEPVPEEESEQFPTGQKYYALMEVSRVDGSQSWTAVDEWRSWGMGYTYPDVLKWPASGHDLYFTNVPVPDGCTRYVNGGDLWRLDLSTGEVSEILPFVGLVLALSPDDSQLAYFGSYGKGMTLLDLATGAERPIELPSFGDAWDMGGLSWSPDGRHLMITQLISLFNPCDEETDTAIIVVSIDSLEVTPLIEPGQGDLSVVEWLANDSVHLAGEDGEAWKLNIISGELLPYAESGAPQG